MEQPLSSPSPQPTIVTRRWWQFALIGFALLIAAVLWLASPVVPRSTVPVQLTIEPGMSARAIADRLKAEGLVRSSTVFEAYVALRGVVRDLKAGTYILSPSMDVPEIAQMIASGQALSTDIVATIPEGSNAWEVDRILVHAGLTRAGTFARTWQGSEGKLFPETYRFRKDATVADIGQRMQEEFSARAGNYTEQEVIIASMLEKEAKTANDMALVAGIIQKRIAQNMPLQIDATVAYGWCLRRWLPSSSLATCDVTQAPIATEVKVDGPYNTYARVSLPAGPISNPGLQALKAATHPQDSPYLYYLSTRDGSQLVYAKTLAEHLANRKRYLGF